MFRHPRHQPFKNARHFHPSFVDVEARGSFAEPGSAFCPSPAKDAPSVGRGHSLQPSVLPFPLQCVGLKRSFHRPKRFTNCTWCFDRPRFHGFFPPNGAFLLVPRNNLRRFSLQPSFDARAPMGWTHVSVHVVQIHSVVSQPQHRCLSFVSAARRVRPNQRHVALQAFPCFCCVRSQPTTHQRPRGGDASPPRRHRHDVPATTPVDVLALLASHKLRATLTRGSLVLSCFFLCVFFFVTIRIGPSRATWKPRSLLAPFLVDHRHHAHASGRVGCACGSLHLGRKRNGSSLPTSIPCP